jgi:hypothetical protein
MGFSAIIFQFLHNSNLRAFFGRAYNYNTLALALGTRPFWKPPSWIEVAVLQIESQFVVAFTAQSDNTNIIYL